MSMAQNDKNGGFKGLEGLVSELTLSRITQAAETPARSQGESAGPAPESNAAQRPVAPPSRKRDYGRWRAQFGAPIGDLPAPKTALIIGGVIVVIVLAVNSNDKQPSAGYSTPPNAINTGVSSAPTPTAHTASPVERVPTVGTNRTLTGSELTYCVAQDARIRAVQPQVNRRSDREIKGFNELIADFNGRCSNFQYYVNEMSEVRALIDARHEAIAQQAQMWLTQWRKGDGRTTSGRATAPYSRPNVEDSAVDADGLADADSEDKPKDEDP